MYIYICIYVYIYAYIYICIYVYIYAYIPMCVYTHARTHTHAHKRTHTRTHTRAHTHQWRFDLSIIRGAACNHVNLVDEALQQAEASYEVCLSASVCVCMRVRVRVHVHVRVCMRVHARMPLFLSLSKIRTAGWMRRSSLPRPRL